MELAVNIPEQLPQVGQASFSSCEIRSWGTASSADSIIASIRSICSSPIFPASIGPPETKMAGMFSRMAAISMPGVILSQLLMHTIASTWCALIMYSIESAIRSRDGSEYNIPSCPMAMPSSTAMVLNSAAKHPSFSISAFTICPISCRCACPGTNWVNEFTTAIMGFPICSSFIPLARHNARAPAISRPDVDLLLRSCFLSLLSIPVIFILIFYFFY
ncbi:hypothetical protein SDC9_174113 [bioreactor metagenome]|uniref:Uncharacterized protein n=1 Tax=bioreactor metagenome TaxID=1076179 RepID=A0A645GIE5_9ZZZZ